jgi:hypothetical protein
MHRFNLTFIQARHVLLGPRLHAKCPCTPDFSLSPHKLPDLACLSIYSLTLFNMPNAHALLTPCPHAII